MALMSCGGPPTATPDAGTAVDSGLSIIDAGVKPADSGNFVDAGESALDGGDHSTNAGQADGGIAPMSDAGAIDSGLLPKSDVGRGAIEIVFPPLAEQVHVKVDLAGLNDDYTTRYLDSPPASPEAVYKIKVPANRRFSVTAIPLAGSGADTQIWLSSSPCFTGNTVGYGDGLRVDRLVERTLPAGDYYLFIENRGQVGVGMVDLVIALKNGLGRPWVWRARSLRRAFLSFASMECAAIPSAQGARMTARHAARAVGAHQTAHAALASIKRHVTMV